MSVATVIAATVGPGVAAQLDRGSSLMELDALAAEEYLGSDDVVQAAAPEIRSLARTIRGERRDDVEFARAAFEWVRDEIRHSWDAQDPRVTVTATEVLDHGVGLCYAKSHLLAALLRSHQVPAGLCYQRVNGSDGFFVYGLVAVYLD